MKDKDFLLILILVVLNVLLIVIAQYRILKSNTLTKKMKLANTIMIWIIPYLWSLLVILITRNAKNISYYKERYIESGYGGYINYGE